MKTIFILLISICTTANAQYTQLISFDEPTNGSQPNTSLFYDGTFLYGMTRIGGTYEYGTIFKIKPNGTGYVKLLGFKGTENGRNPMGALISDGTFLYGMTANGGKMGKGTIFKIKTDGTDYLKIHDFVGSGNGSNPIGSLVFDGTYLYGMTPLINTNEKGTIFKIKQDGTGFTKIYDFSATNESYPRGSLILGGTFLYGTTQLGGAKNAGTIFKIMTDGTGYVKLHDFDSSLSGAYPICSLVSDGTFLYGMTESGGKNGAGAIFKIKLDGTGFEKLLDFAFVANGGFPKGSLIFDGTFLYGMTSVGGASSKGVMFKIMPNGTGFSKLLDFDGITNGSSPTGDLIYDGESLYGTTGSYVGAFDKGTVFKFQLSTNTGIAENALETSLTIYPNPSNGNFTIEMKETSTNSNIEICNSMGQNLFNQVINASKTTINTGLKSGIYFVKVCDSKGQMHAKRMIIQQ